MNYFGSTSPPDVFANPLLVPQSNDYLGYLIIYFHIALLVLLRLFSIFFIMLILKSVDSIVSFSNSSLESTPTLVTSTNFLF